MKKQSFSDIKIKSCKDRKQDKPQQDKHKTYKQWAILQNEAALEVVVFNKEMPIVHIYT